MAQYVITVELAAGPVRFLYNDEAKALRKALKFQRVGRPFTLEADGVALR